MSTAVKEAHPQIEPMATQLPIQGGMTAELPKLLHGDHVYWFQDQHCTGEPSDAIVTGIGEGNLLKVHVLLKERHGVMIRECCRHYQDPLWQNIIENPDGAWRPSPKTLETWRLRALLPVLESLAGPTTKK